MNLNTGLEGGFQIAAAAAYLMAAAGYGAHLVLRQPPLARSARFLTMAAVVLHTVAIGIHCAVTRQTPFTAPAETLSASAWAIALVYLILESLPRPAPRALGAVALPAAFLCLFTGVVMHRAASTTTPAIARMLDSRLISLHVIAVLFSFGLLVLAFACAALYLMQHSMLKHKRVGGGLFGKLPPLASIENLGFTLVAFAFPLLTLSLVAGIIRAIGGGMEGAWAADPKVVASLATWLVYGIYLLLHVTAHWRGPRANYLLIGGLLVALVTYFIPNTVHRFG